MTTQRIPVKKTALPKKQSVPTATRRATATRSTAGTYSKPTDCKAKNPRTCPVHGDLIRHYENYKEAKRKKGYTPEPGHGGKAIYRSSKDFLYTQAAMDNKILALLQDPKSTESQIQTYLLEAKDPEVKAAAAQVLQQRQAALDELVKQRDEAWEHFKAAVSEFTQQLKDTILIGVLEDFRDLLNDKRETQDDYERVERINELLERWNAGIVRLEHPTAAVNEITKRLYTAITATNKVSFAEMRRSQGEF